MRIACVHVPQFALQSLCRVDASLRGAAVAVVGAGADPGSGIRPSVALHSPIVLACSRAAWALGVRVGMTASAARFASSELRVVVADAALERETARAIADALLGVSAVVDTGGRGAASGTHLAIYCEVPSRARGQAFGDRLVELVGQFGLAARIGIADDRFTAWVAAAHGGSEERGVISVPRGGSAAFLAPRPLALLAITPEVQHMLEALGVRTLGEFAALPAPSVARPLEADYQALARGESGSALRPYAPEAPVREELVAGHAGILFSGEAVVATLARRLALRLAGRGRGAERLEITVSSEAGQRVVPVLAGEPVSSQHELVELIAPWFGEGLGAVAKLRVVVTSEALVGMSAPADQTEASIEGSIEGSIDAMSSALTRAQRAQLAQIGSLGAPDEARPSASPRSQPWQLIAPDPLRSERRDAHRRTRRAKQQRRRPVELAQSQLFANLDG